MSADLSFVKSVSRSRAKPVLSVLIPYYHDDPSALLHALLAQCHNRKDVEILIYDDGSNDADLNAKVCAIVKAAETPVQLIIAAQNKGRSSARNTLQETARANWILFLDADMRPQNAHFISDYMDLIAGDAADVIFGGFTVPKTSDDPDTELHRALSEVSDCLSLEARQIRGPQYVASSNLCARKRVLEEEPFDPDFVGWGWEDSEWAARVNEKFSLRHADIPALHLGLESTDTLLKRFKDSAPNYVRFTQKHPDLAQTLTLFRLSRNLRRVPGQGLMRPLLKLLVKFRHGPLKLRLFALKMWRASWYAEALA